jgi:UDP-3-O-[3-hydroxymyristoyl] glucosamine N-acyltransferase
VAATLEQLAALVRGRLEGDGSVPINSARPVDEAGPGDITFIESERYARLLKASPASAAIVGPHFKTATNPDMPVIEVDDPMTAFLAVRTHLVGTGKPRWVGVHKMAAVADSAVLGADVAVHAFVAIGEDVEVGDGSTLHPGAVIGDRCKLGKGVIIHPNAVLYADVTVGDRVEVHAGTVVGGDGFKYHMVDGKHIKVPHTGKVEIGDDVEIGSNCTIDRATFETTRIGEGTKVDNLVMIGHNNQIGKHNLLCGQVGIAGSCKTGDYVVMAGQAGIKDHTEIGAKVMVGAQAGVHRNVPSGQNVLGSPAIPIREQRRIFQMIARLPEMHKQLRELVTLAGHLSPNGTPKAEPSTEDDPTGF